MALQGKYVDENGKEFPNAYFKIVKASIVANDWEVLTPQEDEVIVTEMVTRHKGEAIAMVWADEGAYKNRAVPINAVFVNFDLAPLKPFNPEANQNVLVQAYEHLKTFFEGIQLETVW